MIIYFILFIYVSQFMICAIINLINGTRIPKSMKELIIMTTLPIMIFNLKKYR
jgi:hypothetical protein